MCSSIACNRLLKTYWHSQNEIKYSWANSSPRHAAPTASARATWLSRADERASTATDSTAQTLSQHEKPTSSRGLKKRGPLCIFWADGFTDRKHDPDEQDCDVAEGIDGGSDPNLQHDMHFHGVIRTIGGRSSFCGSTQRLPFFFFTMTSIKSIYGATAVNILQTLGPPFFLRHLHRHDCIRH